MLKTKPFSGSAALCSPSPPTLPRAPSPRPPSSAPAHLLRETSLTARARGLLRASRQPPPPLAAQLAGFWRLAGPRFRARTPEEQGPSPGPVSASWLWSVICWKGKEGRLSHLGGAGHLRAHQLREVGCGALERGPRSRPSSPASPSPSAEPSELTQVAGKMLPPPFQAAAHLCPDKASY